MKQEGKFRLSWEMVKMTELWRFMDHDPTFYENARQTLGNAQIPAEYWYPVEVEFDGIKEYSRFDQARQLQQWAVEDRQFVRNVKLEKMVETPTWEEVRIQ